MIFFRLLYHFFFRLLSQTIFCHDGFLDSMLDGMLDSALEGKFEGKFEGAGDVILHRCCSDLLSLFLTSMTVI